MRKLFTICALLCAVTVAAQTPKITVLMFPNKTIAYAYASYLEGTFAVIESPVQGRTNYLVFGAETAATGAIPSRPRNVELEVFADRSDAIACFDLIHIGDSTVTHWLIYTVIDKGIISYQSDWIVWRVQPAHINVDGGTNNGSGHITYGHD